MNKNNCVDIELSVHQLVDFLLRSGDIDERVFNSSSMNEGTFVHALYQSKQGDNYISEYYLKETFTIDQISVSLDGRADGIIKKNEKEYIIDEIKSTVIDLQEFRDTNIDWHLGQAKCYAYMFAKEKELKTIGVRLTYIKQGNIKHKLYDEYLFTFDELEKFLFDLLNEYLSFYNQILRHIQNKNRSIETLPFAFPNYRKGQRELAKYAYSVAKKGGRLFVEAPTGIGKTISTLYPYIKASKDDEKSKIFYLTAKTSGKLNAENALFLLKEKGLDCYSVTLTAKDKICFCKDKGCNPDECPFAKGYYSKILGVIKESLSTDSFFNYDTVVSIAETHSVCPFELQLDLSLFCDVIICDYNYAFDPTSYLQRFFDNDSSHYLFLVDEAHNLVDRSRKMYSAAISKSSFEETRKSLRHIPNKKLKNSLSKIKLLFERFSDLKDGQTEYDDLLIHDYRDIQNFTKIYLEESKEHHDDITSQTTNFYLECNRFLKIADLFDDNYLFYINKDEDISLNLCCLDASKFLKRRLHSVKSATIFSATLTPIDYYINLLGGDIENDSFLSLSSPFKKENLRLVIAPKVSIKYKNRDSSYSKVASYIENFIGEEIGNYFVYLPSYEYLEKVLPLINFGKDVDLHIQSKDMDDIQKNAFLDYFEKNPTRTHVGFAIIGGSFAEGIDLVEDRLSKVVIVGIGLSKINYESNKIASLFSSRGLNGYNYAYLFPGMNKIMQAIGRVIRTENDKGEVLLIDERYMTAEYQNLYQKQYSQYEVIISPEEYIKKV